MANTQGAGLLGQDFAQQIKRTIARVDASPFGGDITRIPTDLSGDTTYVPKTFRVCTFTGSWAINAEKTVTFRGVTTTPNTVSAVNLFTEFTQTTATVDCAIAKDGTAWYLIAPTGVDKKTVQTSVITNVSLGTAGLQFTRLDIKIFETVSSSFVTIGTTACT
jgi:hypothetical protein